jgi:hypothetical protein
VGEPLDLARQLRAALDVTHTPLPQSAPPHPTTPLDPDQLARILHGEAEVGDQGVVTVTVHRTTGVQIEGVPVQPETGIATSIEFQPLGDTTAAVVSDFALTAAEVDPVVRHMLVDLGWFQGCLYNQETAEHPQLFFDHMLKVGDAYTLAREIRQGLDLTQSE